MHYRKYLIKTGAVLLLILPVIIILFLVNFFSLKNIDPSAKKVTVTIPKGASIDAICDTLVSNKLVEDKEIFKFWLTTLEKDRALKAGKFDIPMGLNYAQLIQYLTQAQAKEIKITLLEGWLIEDIARKLSDKLNIDSLKFRKICYDLEFLQRNSIEAQNAEGYLLPDTYFFYWGMDEREIADHLVNQTRAIFNDSVRAQLEHLRMSMHQILTLASIIEGEAIFDDERSLVSSVYHNRLRRRIKLQADPTIQYILKGPPRRLLYKDLRVDSPYNTYKYYGLPPGPINNPGKNSIMAAIYPEETNLLYFVARGDGRHTFTKTAAEHAREKAKFDRIRREVSRNRNRAIKEK
jgi:UPF0755 protein